MAVLILAFCGFVPIGAALATGVGHSVSRPVLRMLGVFVPIALCVVAVYALTRNPDDCLAGVLGASLGIQLEYFMRKRQRPGRQVQR